MLAHMEKLISALGLFVFIGIAWLLSTELFLGDLLHQHIQLGNLHALRHRIDVGGGQRKAVRQDHGSIHENKYLRHLGWCR